jgi:glycerol-3-phosphate dehydrogenase
LLIIGGGCNGAGVALEAASRGLKVALIDQQDFGEGTSSRSTKLAHGGLRYLEQIFKRDGNIVENYELLCEALSERNYFLDSAPFINKPIQIFIPERSMIKNLFWNFPGCIMYHSIYVINSLFGNSLSSLPGPGLYLKRSLKKNFPKLPEVWKARSSAIYEVQIIDT